MELKITYIKDIIRCFAGKSMFYIELELDYNEDCLFMDYRKFKEHIEEGLLVDSEVFFDAVKLQKYNIEYMNNDNEIIPIGIVGNNNNYYNERFVIAFKNLDKYYEYEKYINNIIKAIEINYKKDKNFSKNDDNQMIRNQLYESGEIWGLSEIIDLDTNKSRFKLYEEMVEIYLDNFEQKKKEWIKKIEKCKAVEGERRIYEKLDLY